MSVRHVPDVVYRQVLGFRPLELDLYLPPGAAAPVIVYLHGGGWRRGSRRETLPALGPGFYERLAGQGFALVAADYRLSGEARFPAPLDDVLAVLAWVREHGAAYGLNGSRTFLWGESAGAHLALLAALTGGCVSGVVAWFPPTDLLGLAAADPDSREAQLLGAPPQEVPELARTASPLHHARPDAPPILLMHGDADRLVPAGQSVRLADALRAAGAPVELDLIDGADHMWEGAADVDALVRRAVDFLRTG